MKDVVVFQPVGAQTKLALYAREVRDLILRGQRHADKITDGEVALFLEFCKWKGANPLEGDSYLIKYDGGKPASFVLGIHHFHKLAESDPGYRGCEHGILYTTAAEPDVIKSRVGTTLLPGWTLIAGWARVWKKNRREPYYREAQLSTYQKTFRDKNTGELEPAARWAIDPAGMICKVAIAQAKREACPMRLGGGYIEEEIEHTDVAPHDAGWDAKDDAQALQEARETLDARVQAYVPEGDDLDLEYLHLYLTEVFSEFARKDPDISQLAFYHRLTDNVTPQTIAKMLEKYRAWLEKNPPQAEPETPSRQA